MPAKNTSDCGSTTEPPAKSRNEHPRKHNNCSWFHRRKCVRNENPFVPHVGAALVVKQMKIETLSAKI